MSPRRRAWCGVLRISSYSFSRRPSLDSLDVPQIGKHVPLVTIDPRRRMSFPHASSQIQFASRRTYVRFARRFVRRSFPQAATSRQTFRLTTTTFLSLAFAGSAFGRRPYPGQLMIRSVGPNEHSAARSRCEPAGSSLVRPTTVPSHSNHSQHHHEPSDGYPGKRQTR